MYCFVFKPAFYFVYVQLPPTTIVGGDLRIMSYFRTKFCSHIDKILWFIISMLDRYTKMLSDLFTKYCN